MRLSSIERYRAESVTPPYDMHDEYDRAIVTLLQLYVDYRERCELSGEEKPFRAPWELEMYLRDLRANVDGEREFSDYQSAHDTVIAVYEALFDERGVVGHNVPGAFWGVEMIDAPRESPLAPDRAIVALSHMVRAALGELLTQSEVARREGVDRAAIHARVRTGRYRALRIGRNVLIPASQLGEVHFDRESFEEAPFTEESG